MNHAEVYNEDEVYKQKDIISVYRYRTRKNSSRAFRSRRVEGGIEFLSEVFVLDVKTMTFKQKFLSYILPTDNFDEETIQATLDRKEGVKISIELPRDEE